MNLPKSDNFYLLNTNFKNYLPAGLDSVRDQL